MQFSLIDDLSTLTTIPTTNLNQLTKKANYCICNCIEESSLNNDNLTDIDIGIGRLSIYVENNNILYRFTPAKSLEDNIKKTVIEKHNVMTNIVENALTNKIINTYKDYI